jgi:hypothetical protein
MFIFIRFPFSKTNLLKWGCCALRAQNIGLGTSLGIAKIIKLKPVRTLTSEPNNGSLKPSHPKVPVPRENEQSGDNFETASSIRSRALRVPCHLSPGCSGHPWDALQFLQQICNPSASGSRARSSNGREERRTEASGRLL